MTNNIYKILVIGAGWEYSFGWHTYEEATGHSYYLGREHAADGLSREIFIR